MLNKPLVTCAFSTYNAESSIIKALQSAINQTYENKEIVVVDDCSEDETLKKIKEFNLKINENIKIYENKINVGIGEIRNQLIKNSNGDFIAFFDDDDFSFPQRISEQIKFITDFESKNKIEDSLSPLCYSKRKIFYSKKNYLICNSISFDTSKSPKNNGVLALLSAEKIDNKAISGSTATCTLCVRKKTLIKIGGFDRNLRRYEDLDLAIRSLMKNISLISVENILIYQFYKNKSYKRNEELYELKLILKHKRFLEKYKLFEFSLNFAKLKHSLFKFETLSSIKYFIYLFLNYPNNLFKKISGTFKTFLFSILNKIFINQL